MSIQKRMYLGLLVVVAAISAALLPGCEGERPREPAAAVAAPVGTALQAPGKAPPIPKEGPLARPRSLQ
jgi:hypothetical protein